MVSFLENLGKRKEPPGFEKTLTKVAKTSEDDKTQILDLCLAKGVKLQRLLGGNPMNKIYFCFLLSVLVCSHNYSTGMIVFFVLISVCDK